MSERVDRLVRDIKKAADREMLKPAGEGRLFEEALRALTFSDRQIKLVKAAMEETCSYCRDSEHPCYCANDE